MNKLFEVKGVKGLRKLMKEIAVTASTGKHDNELIGRTAIPLKVCFIYLFYFCIRRKIFEKKTKKQKNPFILFYRQFQHLVLKYGIVLKKDQKVVHVVLY